PPPERVVLNSALSPWQRSRSVREEAVNFESTVSVPEFVTLLHAPRTSIAYVSASLRTAFEIRSELLVRPGNNKTSFLHAYENGPVPDATGCSSTGSPTHTVGEPIGLALVGVRFAILRHGQRIL